MALTRALGTALAAVVGSLVLASTGAAAPVRPASDHVLTTAHFMVHYYTDVDPKTGAPANDYSTQTDAGDIAAYAEQAYAAYVSWGYTPPVNDGDGLTDIYVTDLSGPPALESVASYDSGVPGPPSSGDFEIATPTQLAGFAKTHGVTTTQEEQEIVAENVFYMFELAKWAPLAPGSDMWLFYGSAAWAAFASTSFQPAVGAIGDPDIALDCSETLPSHQMCDPAFYSDAGFARWAFFNLLASKYGNSFFNSVLTNLGAGQSSDTAVSNALASTGTTLADQYIDYVNAYMSGTLGPLQLDSARPPAYASVTTGVDAISAPTTAAVVPVDHLSARYVTFERGDGDGSHACYAATLTVDVAIPSGTSSQPYFYWDVSGSSPEPLSVNGATASITVPWDTCDWGSTLGWLSLPNASTTVDGAEFSVTYTMTVDTSTPASATSAPTPATIWGTTVPVPTNDVAPAIEVYGPELLRLSASSPSIRLIVESDGPGTLNAALGAAGLGQRTLRAGNNDLRFVVPKSLLTSLRRSAVAANLLTLTPLSPTGTVTGQAVTRHVVIAVAKKKPKHTAKKHKK